MRAYSESGEEALRARHLLKDWAGEGFLSAAQYQRMEQETVCEFRRTNIFLRLVLFLFTLIVVGAAVALFFVVFLSHPSEQTTGISLLIFAALSYAAAEFAVSRARLYRYGIEEALAVCSVAFLCVGMKAFFTGPADLPVPATGVLVSLWMWYRFGLPYMFLAAMIFVILLPSHWASSHAAQHLLVAAIYTAGLITIVTVRSRHRFTYLDDGYSIVEALLWLGIYLAINLQLSSLNLLAEWWGAPHTANEFPENLLLGHLGINVVPAAGRTCTRHPRQRSIRNRGGHDCRRPDPRHQQALSRLAAAYLGSDAARRIIGGRRSLHPSLARRRPRRSSPWLHRPAPFR